MRKFALLSVFNKDGIVEFAQALIALGYALIASGGTRDALLKAGVEVNDVAWLVGGKAILGHRVVTLSREIHAALLADPKNFDHVKEMEAIKVPFIDIVCVDPYPMKAAIAAGKTRAEVIELTDIGGPAMLRSAAKGRRIVVCDPADRMKTIAWLKEGKPDEDAYVTALIAKAEGVAADYALASARYHSGGKIDGMIGTQALELAYGENKETPAGYFAVADEANPFSIHRFTQVGGGPPSSINVTDMDRARNTMNRLAAAWKLNFGTVPLIGVAVKHGTPCGIAIGATPLEVIRKLIDCDPLSIFGGVIMFNFEITLEAATELREYRRGKLKNPYDVVVAPGYDEGSSGELERKKSGKTRVFENAALATDAISVLPLSLRRVPVTGGFLVLPPSSFLLQVNDDRMERHVPDGARPVTEQQKRDLVIAFAACATSPSNTFSIACDDMLIANGAGQQSRVDVVNLATDRMVKRGHGDKAARAAGVSDSFFPFPDGLEAAAKGGLRFVWSTIAPEPKPEVVAAGMKAGVTHWMLSDAIARLFFGHFGC